MDYLSSSFQPHRLGKINVTAYLIRTPQEYSTDDSWVRRTHKEMPSFEIRRVRVKQDEMYRRKLPRDVVMIELINS